MLGSETIPAGSSGYLTDGFQFLDLGTTFDLAPGTYTIAETITSIADPDNDTFYSLVTGLTTDPDVTFITSARTYSAGLSYPTALGGFNDGYFGPNFIFTVIRYYPPARRSQPRRACWERGWPGSGLRRAAAGPIREKAPVLAAGRPPAAVSVNPCHPYPGGIMPAYQFRVDQRHIIRRPTPSTATTTGSRWPGPCRTP